MSCQRKSFALWLSLALLLVGCSASPPDLGAKPDRLVDAEKMADILVEVHLTEARVSKLGLVATDSAALVFKRLHFATLKKFEVDTAAYTRSYIYYSSRPTLLAGIYEDVVAQLKEAEKKAHAKQGAKPTVQ